MINARNASMLALHDCSKRDSCEQMSIWCPQNVYGEKMCFLEGNSKFDSNDVYAVNSWNDVHFVSYDEAHSWSGFWNTMHCGVSFDDSCAFEHHEWLQCENMSSPCQVTPYPTTEPTEPTLDPTLGPTVDPTSSPTNEPTMDPTLTPTVDPTSPTNAPTTPTLQPTSDPTKGPSDSPSNTPTESPSPAPSVAPTVSPTDSPLSLAEILAKLEDGQVLEDHLDYTLYVLAGIGCMSVAVAMLYMKLKGALKSKMASDDQKYGSFIMFGLQIIDVLSDLAFALQVC